MLKENIFIDKNNNDIFSKYENIKIKKIYLTISYIDKNVIRILKCLSNEKDVIDKIIKYHTSLLIFLQKDGENIILKMEKILAGVVLSKVKSLNNMVYFKSIKLSKRKILLSKFINNFIKEKGKNILNSYNYVTDNCFTFVNDILKCNNLLLPRNNFVKNVYKFYLNIWIENKNKKGYGFSTDTLLKITNHIMKYKIIRILIILIAHLVS